MKNLSKCRCKSILTIVFLLTICFLNYTLLKDYTKIKGEVLEGIQHLPPKKEDLKTGEPLLNNVTTFYNIYVPLNQDPSNALSIINEQLSERNNSLVPNSPLYYISLGQNISLNCTNCHQISHAERGDEVNTITQIYNYCLNHSTHDVIYMHNKGSFHPSHENDLLRRMLTKSIYSSACLLSSSSSHNCSICSARFSTYPHYHTPGNMWKAQCSYIIKLRPPSDFEAAMNHVLQVAPKNLFGRLRALRPSHLGRGRYAVEHWIHSHPSMLPCDVYPGFYRWNYDNLPTSDQSWEPELSAAPRFQNMSVYDQYHTMNTSECGSSCSWLTLAGRIQEWRTLYNEIPPNTSWVWKFYNNSGELWLNTFNFV